jgi:hypothetical protein
MFASHVARHKHFGCCVDVKWKWWRLLDALTHDVHINNTETLQNTIFCECKQWILVDISLTCGRRIFSFQITPTVKMEA